MHVPKGWLRKKIEEKNFRLSIDTLKEKQLGIDRSFSGYVRIFGTTSQNTHDDYYLLIENGKIIGAEKVEIEKNIRTLREESLEKMECTYVECEIQVVKLERSEMEIAKEINENCLLENKIEFKSELNRKELLKKMNIDNIDVEDLLYKFEKRKEQL